jgi:uncharacterized protein YqgV (UPF0045/DUF77 family)
VNAISVQLSVYPLRQPRVGPAISMALEAFRARGLDVRAGTMSTVIVGEPGAVFDGLKESFQSAASLGDLVMVLSISNCCPVTTAEQHSP